MDDISKLISPELRQAVETHGFHKVAAQLYGVNVIDEKTISEIIGTKLAARRLEWREIAAGLSALNTLVR